jgi:glycosyltransferase involved in cell wall biosynthesis
MKIWFFEIGEPLPLEPNVRLHRYGTLTRHLADLGHQVTWWTSSFSHAPKKHFVDEFTEMKFGKVDLKIIPGGGYKKNISLKRIQHYKLFAAQIRQRITKHPPPDVIVAPIPAIEISTEIINHPHLKSVPIVVDIRDLWPDEFVNLVPPFVQPLAKLALFSKYSQLTKVCDRAAGMTGVSQNCVDYGMKHRKALRSIPSRVMPIGYDRKEHPKEQYASATKKWKDLLDPDAFILCFFGTIGRFFNMDTVIEAARNFQKAEIKVQFVLCGDGSNLSAYKEKAKDLAGVIFPGWVNGVEIAALMECADAGLAPYREGVAMKMPNKPFEYFSGNLPVISSISGEIEVLIKAHKCGLRYSANDPESLMEAINHYRLNPEAAAAAGDNARNLLESQFTSEKIAKQWETFLVEVLNHSNMITPSNDG